MAYLKDYQALGSSGECTIVKAYPSLMKFSPTSKRKYLRQRIKMFANNSVFKFKYLQRQHLPVLELLLIEFALFLNRNVLY